MDHPLPSPRAARWRRLCDCLAVAALALAQPALIAADTPAGPSCMECHSDAALTMERGGKTVNLQVKEAEIAASVHASLECTSCHEGYDPLATPHKEPPAKVDCLGCHEDLAKSHAFHRDFAAKPFVATPQTDCVACHGGHAVKAPKGADGAFAGSRVVDACRTCHEHQTSHFLASAHGAALKSGRPEAPGCLSCHASGITTGDGTALGVKLEQSRLCLACHLDNPRVLEKSVLGAKFMSSYGQSVHGAALTKGNARAANCVDCHGSHEMDKAMVASSTVHPLHIAETCAKCHRETAAAYAAGVHSIALNQGNMDSPTCTTCHGEHSILVHSDPNAPVSARNVSQMVCGSCHASVRLNQRYGLATDRFTTFSDSYHGLATRGGAVEAVNCASCHGAHAIRNSQDPRSSVHKERLAQTCGQCHPGANARFAMGSVHVNERSETQDPIVYWVATIYIWMIVVVVGGMFAHNLLDFVKKVRRKIAIQKGQILESELPHRLYLRMTVNERIQHATLVISFVALVITGFMLRYPEAWWVVTIRGWSDHLFEWRSLIHRVAGVVMLAGGTWHVAYLAFTHRGRQLFRDLLPNRRDVTDPIGVVRYNLGLAAERPKFGRFSYIEKAEYWALIWGTLVMGATGAVLWFENTFIGLFTKLGYDISRTVHFYEAILATLAIIVWHFYFVIFNPDVYPMNLAWLTGRLSEKEMHEDHPLELEAIKAERADEAAAALPQPPTGPEGKPPAGH